MAKQSMGYMGGFSGRLGPAVGYMWNGKWCMRSYRRHVANPRTEAQVAQRTIFKQEVQLAARMRWAVATTLREVAREEGMTAFNLFVSLNQPAFSLNDGQLQVDYRALRLSVGDVAPVEAGTMEWTADNVLNVSFAKGGGNAYDLVYLYVYVPELGSGFLSAPVHRRTKRFEVALPDAFAGCEAQVYLMVQHDDGRWSLSTYAGAIELSERVEEEPAEGVETTSAAGAHEVDVPAADAKDSEGAAIRRRRTP